VAELNERELLETWLGANGLQAESIEPDPDEGGALVAKIGRFRMLEDDEDEGLSEGDEGVLTAQLVGLPEKGNHHISYGLAVDGLSGSLTVRSLDMVEEAS
jgi:hypothetical protein